MRSPRAPYDAEMVTVAIGVLPYPLPYPSGGIIVPIADHTIAAATTTVPASAVMTLDAPRSCRSICAGVPPADETRL